MSEQVFKPDFLFSRITNVNFGGDTWLGISLAASSGDTGLPAFSIEVDFPTIGAGTPGFVMTNTSASSTVAISSSTALYRIKKTDLTNPIHTNAGRPLVGFGIHEPPPFVGGGSDTFWLLNLAGFPNTPFGVRFTFSIDQAFADNLGAALLTFDKKQVTAGAFITDLTPKASNSIGGEHPVTMLVNPKSLAIS